MDFQTVVDALYNKFVSLGVTPSGKTLNDMINSVQTVYNSAQVKTAKLGTGSGTYDISSYSKNHICYAVITDIEAGFYAGDGTGVRLNVSASWHGGLITITDNTYYVTFSGGSYSYGNRGTNSSKETIDVTFDCYIAYT